MDDFKVFNVSNIKMEFGGCKLEGGVSEVLDSFNWRCLIDSGADSAGALLPRQKCLAVFASPKPPQTMTDEHKNIIAQLPFLALGKPRSTTYIPGHFCRITKPPSVELCLILHLAWFSHLLCPCPDSPAPLLVSPKHCSLQITCTKPLSTV